ncbi:hypothetical protein Tco_0682326 [Tanacetum coccineum]|uniref:Uncharacterized protein n=1 Tax=Tanacetum coccineum TaxID=301880 RepID=A0ABQ4XRT4_9ASTR
MMTDATEMWNAISQDLVEMNESKKDAELEIHRAGVSTEDANQKFLRSLPSAWLQVSLIMRNKPGMDSLSFDDLYNNLRVFENDVKGSTASSSNLQNVAFVSENTNSTNEVSTAYGVSNTSGHCSKHEQTSTSSDSLLSSQSSCPNWNHEDLDPGRYGGGMDGMLGNKDGSRNWKKEGPRSCSGSNTQRSKGAKPVLAVMVLREYGKEKVYKWVEEQSEEGAEADFTNLETVVNVSPIPTSRINPSHPSTLILGDPTSAVQTRSKVNKSSEAHAFVSYVQKQRRNNHKDFHHCLFACFLSQLEPKKISEALEDEG